MKLAACLQAVLCGILLLSCSSSKEGFSSHLTVSERVSKTEHLLAHGIHVSIGDRITVTSNGKPVISLPLNTGFIYASQRNAAYDYHMASIKVTDRTIRHYPRQKIDAIEVRNGALVITGTCSEEAKNAVSVSYELKLTPASRSRIDFIITVSSPSVNRIGLRFLSSGSECIYGGGAQFSHVNLKGKRVPMLTSEQGVGRGDLPITLGADLTAKAGGDAFTTYCPVPFFLTTENRAFNIDNTGYSIFDLTDEAWIAMTVFTAAGGNQVSGSFFSSENLASLITEYTAKTGRMSPLPAWSYGTILGIQGGSEKVTSVVEDLIRHNNPLSAIWIQDWCGRRVTKFGDQLKWRWYPDEERYPDFRRFVRLMESKGVRVLGYINPFLADRDPEKKDDDFTNPLLAIAREKNYLVKDNTGKPYLIQTVGFPAYLLDLTNPDAVVWIKKIIKDNLIGNGLSGWMADFGEWLPMDAVLHSGVPAEIYHNRYPVDWARINREAIREAGREGEILFFTRAGFSESQRYSTLFWLGDQMVSFGRNDGLPSAVAGTISSGMSGIAFVHSDIGGYTTITNPIMPYRRSKELLLRWAEFEAMTPVYRTHEGNKPRENWQAYTYAGKDGAIRSDDETARYYALFARIHHALRDYFAFYADIASKTGVPVVRHLVLHYPNDEVARSLQYQFLVGEDLLCMPVIEKGAASVRGYLPEGTWRHAFTGKAYPGREWVTVEAPIGRPAVFIREGGRHHQMLEKAFATLGR